MADGELVPFANADNGDDAVALAVTPCKMPDARSLSFKGWVAGTV